MSNYGVVEYFGCNEGSNSCGYCKGIKKDSDYGKCRSGMWAHTLLNTNYQNLIDRNWRRSGKYCYKPILNQICCPMYTIRCDALNFKLKKSQKKVIKKFNRFLMTGEKTSKRNESEIQEMEANNEGLGVEPLLNISEDKSGYKLNLKVEEQKIVTTNTCDDNLVAPHIDVHKSEDKPIDPKNKKAKDLRKERKLIKIMKKEKCDQKMAQNIMNEEFKKKIIKNDKTKSLEEYLTPFENSVNNKYKLTIKYVSTTDEYKQTLDVSHKVYQKYQFSIHGDPIDKCTQKQYKRFLIDSPLENESFELSDELSDEFPDHFGSYHQQYWLDNRLIAVGVIDVLPQCVSSVYLYYDPEFDFLSLGTYSALREIYLVKRLQRFIPDLKYYYMGFYIHCCPKMKYKAKFVPSELLCGETFSWHSIDKCVPKLDLSKYYRFEDNLNAIDLDGTAITDKEIKILFSRKAITFADYKTLRTIDENEEQQIREYASLVGRKSSNTILLYRS